MTKDFGISSLSEHPVMEQKKQSGRDPAAREVWKVAAVVFLGPFMTQLDTTVVNLSFSVIGS